MERTEIASACIALVALGSSCALEVPAAAPARPGPAATATAAAGTARAPAGPAAAAAGGATAPAASYEGHGAGSVPAEIVAKHAPPPLPAALSRRLQAMADVRAPFGGALSPDGKHLFFTWTITGIRHVWRLDAPDRFPVQLTGGEDATGVAAITPDGKHLVVARDHHGEENPGLYLQRAEGGPLEVIQHDKGVQTSLQLVTDDGRFLYYRANDKRPDSYAIYRYEPATKQRELVFGEQGIWRVADLEGDRMLLAKDVGSNMSEYFEYDLGKKALRPLFGQGEREEYEAAYGARPGEILVQTPKLSELRRLYAWKEGTLTPVTPELGHDVQGFSIDRARKRVLFEVNEGGFTRLRALDAKTFKEIELPKLPPADHVTHVHTTPNGRWSTLRVDQPTAPPASYVFDWTTRKLVRWHVASTPEIDTSKFAVAKLEHYPARDGTRIPMFVRRPERCDGPCPVVVSFHGGPEAQARPGFNPRAQAFVDAGFVYVEPNVRGSDGYGKTWLHADDGQKRLDIITDIEDCAKHIRSAWAQGGKAPKIGVVGGSYGGYSALIAMTLFAGAYDAGASIVGIGNLVTFLENTAPYRRILRISEYGDPQKDREVLRKLSPATYVDRVKAPLLVIQGVTDPRVPAGEALQIHGALEAKGIPSQLILFADEGHGAQKRDNQVLMHGHVLRFFQAHLLGKKEGP